MKILKLIQDFRTKNRRKKIAFGISILLILLFVALVLPVPLVIRNGLIYALSVFVISSIYFFIVSSSYDIKTKKLKVVDLWSMLTWVVLLSVMSIGGGFVGWVFLVTAFLLFTIQLFLRFCIFFFEKKFQKK